MELLQITGLDNKAYEKQLNKEIKSEFERISRFILLMQETRPDYRSVLNTESSLLHQIKSSHWRLWEKKNVFTDEKGLHFEPRDLRNGFDFSRDPKKMRFLTPDHADWKNVRLYGVVENYRHHFLFSSENYNEAMAKHFVIRQKIRLRVKKFTKNAAIFFLHDELQSRDLICNDFKTFRSHFLITTANYTQLDRLIWRGTTKELVQLFYGLEHEGCLNTTDISFRKMLPLHFLNGKIDNPVPYTEKQIDEAMKEKDSEFTPAVRYILTHFRLHFKRTS